MKLVFALVALLFAAVFAGSVLRTALSSERAIVAGKVLTFTPVPGNEARNIPLQGDITAILADGRTVQLQLNTADDMKAGTAIRVSERVAPWGEVWYRLAD